MNKFLIFPDLEAKGNPLCNKILIEDSQCLGVLNQFIQIINPPRDDFQLTGLPNEDSHFRKEIKALK